MKAFLMLVIYCALIWHKNAFARHKYGAHRCLLFAPILNGVALSSRVDTGIGRRDMVALAQTLSEVTGHGMFN